MAVSAAVTPASVITTSMSSRPQTTKLAEARSFEESTSTISWSARASSFCSAWINTTSACISPRGPSAAAVGPRGLMQADVVLIQAEQKLMNRADQLIVLVDSSKFRASASFVVCDLGAIDVVVTDAGITAAETTMLKAHGVEVIVANPA